MRFIRLTKLFIGDVRRDGFRRAYRFWRIETDQLKALKKK